MTCFWDGLLRRLTKDDWKFVNHKVITSPKMFVGFLKSNMKDAKNILFQNLHLPVQFQREIVRDVQQYDERFIEQGHWTSACDPFLIAVCVIFRLSITHRFAGNTVTLQHTNARRVLQCRSSRTHFY